MAKNIQPYDNVRQSRKQIFLNNIIGGIGWAIGATFGVAIILAIFGFIAHEIDVVPFIGKFIATILANVQQQQYIHH